jgi:hypothetical protein
LCPSMQLLDVLNHLFQRARIMTVAGKDFVAYRHPAPAHHQRDVDLFAVRTMIPRVRSSGVAHFDHLIWPTWVVVLCIIVPVLASWVLRDIFSRRRGRV